MDFGVGFSVKKGFNNLELQLGFFLIGLILYMILPGNAMQYVLQMIADL